MNDLKNEFIRRTIDDLEEICRKLNFPGNENLPENFAREIFRKLHTVKGTAQTFDFPAAARLAHKLENLLSAEKTETFQTGRTNRTNNSLSEGIFHLINSLQKTDFQIPADFAEKLNEFQTAPPAVFFSERVLPEEFSVKLSESERANLRSAQARGKDLFVLEIEFPTATFAGDFRKFRQSLNENGEIVAALPKAKSDENKIGFQIIFASSQIGEETIEKTGAKIIFQVSPNFSTGLQSVLSNIAAHGKNLAASLKKECEFSVSAEPLTLSAEKLKLIFDILLHLVRNAVDHGIKEKGKIEISVAQKKTRLFLTVKDDGDGIDVNKVRSLAARQNLIQTDENLPEQEIIDLIFVHGLTTAEKLSEISGRGAGLETVKNLVESAGGTISVESAKGKGSTFGIFLPAEIAA